MEKENKTLLSMAGTSHSYSSHTECLPSAKVSRENFFSEHDRKSVKIHVFRENSVINWKDNCLIDLCVGSDLASFKDIHSRSLYNTSEYYFASFHDAIADLKTGSIFFGDSKAWADSCFAGIMHGPVHLSPAVEARGDERWFHKDRANITYVDSETPLMPFCHWGSLTNYGHWLANAIVAAHSILPELQTGKVSLIGPPLSDRQKRELLMIGVPNKQIIETSAQYISTSKLIYSSASSTIGNMMPSPLCMDVLQILKSAITVQLDQPSPEYLYVARKGASHSRVMLNEEQLINELSKVGFITIYPHELGFDAQVKAFSKARIIVGQLGAALWSMPFAPKGGTFVEISTSNYASNEYVSIANLMGRKSVQVMVDPLEKSGINDVVLSFNAPIEAIVDIVNQLI